MSDYAIAPTYALLSDGSTVEIRSARAGDFDAIRAMHEQMSPDSSYLRFFSFSPQAPKREARRLCRPPDADHAALLAWLGGGLIGVASYEPTDKPGVAEIAFAVSDQMHGRGVATLLLEHLVSAARQRGLAAFAAETLPENVAMQRVFADAGLQVRRQFTDGVVELTMPIPRGASESQLDSYLDAVAERASRADVASLRHLLEPSSIAVIGASRARGSAGREILRNIVTGGFAGTVHVVNASGEPIEGITSLPSAAHLPDGVDAAVIAVPAAEVADVAAECGRRGVRALIVITAGFDAAAGAQLLAICRRYGMRLVGPNCFGVVNTSVGLNATFAQTLPPAGSAGIVVQSGGVGVALLEHIARLGIGVSSFASVGDKYDVSSNDLLTWWEQDGRTRMAVLYVESFGSPRGFARTARRLARELPVLTVIGGRSLAGQRAAASHAATPATPLVTQEALFGQAGIVACHSLGELVDTAALLSCQALPEGRRVGIVSSASGVGVLAADACVDAGLSVAELGEDTKQRLAELLPPGAAVSGPVDTTASVTVADFRTCLEEVAADVAVDALLAIGVPTAIADLSAAILAAELAKPVAAVLLDRPDSVSVLSASATRRVPAYGYPETAARALGHAADYRDWRGQEHGEVPELSGIDPSAAGVLVSRFLTGQPGGGWLPGAEAAQLARSYGIPLAAGQPAAGDVVLNASVEQEPVFGPLVVLGLGGIAAEVLSDRAARLAPLTDVDAAQLIRGLRAAPLLLGQHGQPAVDIDGLAGLLLRVSRLADDLPEVADLELSPVIARPDGVHALGVRVRLARATPRDPFLRQLR